MSKFSLVAGPTAIAAATVGALLASTSWYARPVGDDYCAAAQSRVSSPLEAGLSWYETLNGRLVNGALSTTLLSEPVLASIVAPWILLTVLAVALYFAARLAGRVSGVSLPVLPTAVLAGTGVVAAFVATATPYDSLFWLSAAITHPLPLTLAVVGVALSTARPAGGVLACTISLLLGVLVGQFNESVGLLLAGSIVQLVVVLRVLGMARLTALRSPLCLATGGVLGFLAVAFSPGAVSRRAAVDAVTEPMGLRTVVVGPVKQSLLVLADLATQPALVAVLLAAVVLGLVLAVRGASAPWPAGRVRRALILAGPGLVALQWTYGIVLALTVGYRNPAAAPRAYITITVVVLAAVAYYGILAGWALGVRALGLGTARLSVAATALSVLGAVALLLHAPAVADLREQTRARAVAWDARGEQMELAGPGATVPMRRLRISSTPQPAARSSHWLTNCMTLYYGVKRIEVTPS